MNSGDAPLPWRLTKQAVARIESRIKNIVYPHGIDGCSNDDGSFINGVRSWRAADRILALLVILPTVLRDYIPELRAGIRKLVLGLRYLKGRCINGAEAFEFGITPGSTPLLPTDIDQGKKNIIEGLSMIEGEFWD